MLDCSVKCHPAEVEEKHFCYLLLISMESFTPIIYYLDLIFQKIQIYLNKISK